MPLHLGTSGWQYGDWRGRFYPQDLPQARWLAHYAGEFATVEVNASFYRLPSHETFARWAAQTPDGFVFCSKVSRYLTHLRKLTEPEEPVRRFLDAVVGLGGKLGPVLLQLPGNFRARPERLKAVLALFGRRVPVAVELRHPSWFSDEVREILSRHGAALVWADRREEPVGPLWRTAAWGYVRWHEGRGATPPGYREATLATWAERIAGTWPAQQDVWAFFNNDPAACAVADARTFRRLWAAGDHAEALPRCGPQD